MSDVFTDPATGRAYVVDPTTGRSRWIEETEVGGPGAPSPVIRGDSTKRRRRVRNGALAFLGVVGALVVIGNLVPKPKPQAASYTGSAAAPLASGSSPTASANRKPLASAAKPSVNPGPVPSTVRSAPNTARPVASTARPAALTAAQARARAVNILSASVAHYQGALAEGLALAPNNENSDFVNWRVSSGIEQDVTYMNAFRAADAGFTADTEPPSISAWLNDMGNVPGDIGQWVQAAVEWRGGFAGIAPYRTALAQVEADLRAAQRDEIAIAEGR